MKKIYKFILIISAVILIYSGRTFSQDDFREKLQEIKLDKLTKKLELDENTKNTFIDKYKAFSSEMRELNKKRARTYKLMNENLESGNGLDTIVSQLLDYEQQISEKRESFVLDMKSILTSQQIAKMIVFERKFNNEVKKLLKQYQKDNKKEKPFKE
ncbi:MAG: hypothetical protein IT280_08615 [Ignavibacteria bacterium]|nr:hypothetical protein [Ignavibacteria bacterium]